MSRTRRLLFVLDLNGTLLHRTTSNAAAAVAQAHPHARAPDATVRGNAVYLRPGLGDFLRRLFALGAVAVWTSAMADNAVPMVMRAMAGTLSSGGLASASPSVARIAARHAIDLTGTHALTFLWAQDQCDACDADGAPVDLAAHRRGGPKPHFRKDLAKVWAAFPEHSEHTTVIIDDSPAKIPHHEANHVALPPFSVTDADVDHTADDALAVLIARLEVVAARCADSGDVRRALSAALAEDVISDLRRVEL